MRCAAARSCTAIYNNATIQQAMQRYSIKLFNTNKNPKIKNVIKQSFTGLFKIFCDFLKITLDLMRLLLHNTHQASAQANKNLLLLVVIKR